jgi:hypothetical protein
MTQRDNAIKKRAKVMLYRQGLKLCEIIYLTLSESQSGHFLGSKDSLLKLTLLNKKVNHILNMRNSLYYIGSVHRLKFYIQKCQLFDKQIDSIKSSLNLVNENKFGQNDGKFIYNYLQEIVDDKIQFKNRETEDGTNIPLIVTNQIKCDLARTNTTERVRTLQGQ